MLKVAIVTGSTRPGRNNEPVARWVHRLSQERKGAEFELVDIADYNLPLLDEPVPPSLGQYSRVILVDGERQGQGTARGSCFEYMSLVVLSRRSGGGFRWRLVPMMVACSR